MGKRNPICPIRIHNIDMRVMLGRHFGKGYLKFRIIHEYASAGSRAALSPSPSPGAAGEGEP